MMKVVFVLLLVWHSLAAPNVVSYNTGRGGANLLKVLREKLEERRNIDLDAQVMGNSDWLGPRYMEEEEEEDPVNEDLDEEELDIWDLDNDHIGRKDPSGSTTVPPAKTTSTAAKTTSTVAKTTSTAVKTTSTPAKTTSTPAKTTSTPAKTTSTTAPMTTTQKPKGLSSGTITVIVLAVIVGVVAIGGGIYWAWSQKKMCFK